MNRCTPHLISALIFLAASSSLIALPANAQTGELKAGVRQFPKAALRGNMVVLEPPAISMNGKPDQLSVGARIRDVDNRLVLSGPFVNQPLVVNYLRDNTGQVHEVWILNSEEAREKRAGALDTVFNFITGTTAPPVDDGNTPYGQLPSYKQ
ncbi:MAG: hypothetical protein WAW69_08350 [Polaromonas sp.]